MLQPLTAIVLCLALVLYGALGFNVGRARSRHGISAPATTGHPQFERVFRVHQNTLESLIVFMPALWIFSQFVSPVWGAVLGAAWIIGRIIYAIGYYRAADQRSTGFGIAAAASLILLLGGIIGAVSGAVHG